LHVFNGGDGGGGNSSGGSSSMMRAVNIIACFVAACQVAEDGNKEKGT
jgi:hypothetical protein